VRGGVQRKQRRSGARANSVRGDGSIATQAEGSVRKAANVVNRPSNMKIVRQPNQACPRGRVRCRECAQGRWLGCFSVACRRDAAPSGRKAKMSLEGAKVVLMRVMQRLLNAVPVNRIPAAHNRARPVRAFDGTCRKTCSSPSKISPSCRCFSRRTRSAGAKVCGKGRCEAGNRIRDGGCAALRQTARRQRERAW